MKANGTEETITLRWSMDDEAWGHWAQGRGRKTATDVIREGVNEILNSREANERVRKRCRAVEKSRERRGGQAQDAKLHRITVQLCAADWGEACQRVGEPGNPVRSMDLIAAVIIESESWDQNEHYDAGWFEDTLVSDTTGMTLTHGGTLRLGNREQYAVWVIAIGTLITAAATVALAAIALITCDGG